MGSHGIPPRSAVVAQGSAVAERFVLVGALDDVVADCLDLLGTQHARETNHALRAQGSVMHDARPHFAVREQRAAPQVRQESATVSRIPMAGAAEAAVLLRA